MASRKGEPPPKAPLGRPDRLHANPFLANKDRRELHPSNLPRAAPHSAASSSTQKVVAGTRPQSATRNGVTASRDFRSYPRRQHRWSVRPLATDHPDSPNSSPQIALPLSNQTAGLGSQLCSRRKEREPLLEGVGKREKRSKKGRPPPPPLVTRRRGRALHKKGRPAAPRSSGLTAG